MLLSAIYRILCVACLLYANFQLCCATDEVVDEQTARIFCMRNCSHLTKDVYTTQLSSEISTQQACYKECLGKLGEQGKFEIYGKSHILKRIKRENPDKPNSKQETCRRPNQHNPCFNSSVAKSLAIPSKDINLTLHRHSTDGGFSVNISWIHPTESVNWTGRYKLLYDYMNGSNTQYICCRNVNKTSTYVIVYNSSYGLVDHVGVKVYAFPLVYTGEIVRSQVIKIPLFDESTENPETTSPSKASEDPATKAITSPSTDPATKAITSPSTDPAAKAITPPSTDNNTTIAVAIVVPILALLALLTYWYFRHPRDRSSKTGLSDTEFQFDAFIIYSSVDEEWVKKTLLPILEEKNALKCCIHYRDFVPGKPFRENMADSVYMSRKTIAVVSHNFFKSQYCHHEMDMALGRLVKTGDNSVIVIKLDDVDGKKLPKALKERSYIDYYKLNDKETWEKQLIHCVKFSVKHGITQNSFVKSEMGGVHV